MRRGAKTRCAKAGERGILRGLLRVECAQETEGRANAPTAGGGVGDKGDIDKRRRRGQPGEAQRSAEVDVVEDGHVLNPEVRGGQRVERHSCVSHLMRLVGVDGLPPILRRDVNWVTVD